MYKFVSPIGHRPLFVFVTLYHNFIVRDTRRIAVNRFLKLKKEKKKCRYSYQMTMLLFASTNEYIKSIRRPKIVIYG